MGGILEDEAQGGNMTYPGEDEYLTELASRNWRQGQREELARHHDRTFRCRTCGLVWAQPVIHGSLPCCPECEEVEE